MMKGLPAGDILAEYGTQVSEVVSCFQPHERSVCFLLSLGPVVCRIGSVIPCLFSHRMAPPHHSSLHIILHAAGLSLFPCRGVCVARAAMQVGPPNCLAFLK